MPCATGIANESTNPSASSSGAQPSLPTGTQAPQATPASGSSPISNPEDGHEPWWGTTAGGDFYSYGIVIEGTNDPARSTQRPPLEPHQHLLRIRLVYRTHELIIEGADAKTVYDRIGPWSHQSNVKVTFHGRSNSIKAIEGTPDAVPGART